MGSEKLALSTGEGGVHFNPPKNGRLGGFQGFWIMQGLGRTFQNPLVEHLIFRMKARVEGIEHAKFQEIDQAVVKHKFYINPE